MTLHARVVQIFLHGWIVTSFYEKFIDLSNCLHSIQVICGRIDLIKFIRIGGCMKLFTRIKVSYLVICFVPLLLMIISVYIISSVSLNAIEKQYGLSGSSLEILYDPYKFMKSVNSSIINELEASFEKQPYKLEDEAYLDEINALLQENSAFLIIKREGQVVYSGNTEDIDLSTVYISSEGDRDYYLMEDASLYVKQRSFTYTDGSAGQIIIVTDIRSLTPRIKLTAIQTVVVIVVILFLGATLLTVWLYKSIVKPIGELKLAAESIKNGALDFSVESNTEDEIGELFTTFEEMRVKMKEQLEVGMQYEQESKELMSNISHDLKTPITAIKGYVEGIIDGVADTPEKQDKYFRTIYAKANDMQKMIEELFLYSKLDSNSETYSFAKVNLNDYFEDCIEEISVDLEAKNIDLGFFNYADKDVVIIADPEKLKRVITNIINNSAKYIGDKKGIINIRIREEAEFIQVEIEDNGKGIAKKEIPRIFERLYRTDASRNSAQGGSGLGLSIAKKIVEEHGGRIWAASKENIGTCICFVIRKYEENKIYE